jgi:Rod binding domain-containing protein
MSSIPLVIGDPVAQLNSQAAEGDDPKRAAGAAKQFESLLIAELLKSSHSDESGWLGTGEDSSSSSAMQMGEEQLAQAMSNAGGLGLATMIQKGLLSRQP